MFRILKFGIKDISIFGNRIIGISTYDILQYTFQLIPNYVQCFYHLNEKIAYKLQYSLVYNEINIAIQKKKGSNFHTMRVVIGFFVCGILITLILLYSFITPKVKKSLNLPDGEDSQERQRKIGATFKSLECAISPKIQHSKLQSFDQTSNFDLKKLRN
ncbi:unnamed protein product [Paramecium octaurelia]|uniref:Transmembrane protein n=1 Tax=Paramecium octaurelia TaxID=43137 RepID=A0A8S1WR45_PAROT|nr:unnamed protein product [Paramecium octaurelia]